MVFDGFFRRFSPIDTGIDASEPPGPARRPVVGLVLGSGAARGFAHIGVLKALEARGIRPDVIVGTSIGAVVGGCYAAGQLDALGDWARGLLPRRILGYLDIALDGSGLIAGRKLAAQLEEALVGIQIEDLPVKFAAIATEVRTGHEIWLTRGRLVDAIRASYALPGIFSPINVGDRWLVDGALVNPVPVSAARALGAEIVIACNVSTDAMGHGATIAAHGTAEALSDAEAQAPSRSSLSRFFSPERFLKRQIIGNEQRPGLSTVMIDAFNIMQDRITRARLAGDPPDILITPRVGRIGWFDFHRAEELIVQGQRAAERTFETIDEAFTDIMPSETSPADAPPATDPLSAPPPGKVG